MSAGEALAVIIGRAGSKGLPGKNARSVGGLPMVAHAIGHARAAQCVTDLVVSTDSAEIAATARRMGCRVIDRPAALADDTASVHGAVAHALRASGAEQKIIVILYANVPCRPHDLIDRAVQHLIHRGADSVQSYAPVGKHHPAWMVRLNEEGDVERLDPRTVHRRQDLPSCFIPDGGVIVARRNLIMEADPGDPHAFLGAHRAGIETGEGEVVDIDCEADLFAAEALIAFRRRSAARPFLVDGREIDRTRPPYVIAEIGVNHDGERSRLLELVDAAADAGADAVKTQYFRSALLMGPASQLAEYQRRSGAADPRDMIRSLELSRDDLIAFAERARARGVAPILTIFSTSLVDDAVDLGFAAWKTASPDIIHLPLLSRLAETGLPIIVSTGSAHPEEISIARDHLRGARCAFLHCVSAYPAPMNAAALAGIAAVAAITGEPTGYSDHTTECITGGLAVMAGASILEKHLTWSTQASGPDHAASLDPAGFAQYVDAAHTAHRSIGPKGKHVLDIEEEVRRISRQSVTAARSLASGHRLHPQDIMICRPGTGLPPFRFSDTVGRVLKHDVETGRPLTENDLA